MRTEKLIQARHALDEAIKNLDVAHASWSESVTSLHMAEINLRKAQRAMKDCYNTVVDVLNGDAAAGTGNRA
jgi:hypothetical protein